MNAHIINCDNNLLNNYKNQGYIGVGMYLNSTSPQGLSQACRMNYEMFADMKSIRKGDILFIHSVGGIFGAFRIESEFVENLSINSIFLSQNTHYFPGPNKPNSGWRGNISNIPILGDFRRLSFSHFIDSNGTNLCFENGVDSREIFDLKLKKRIWSIPERWKYADKSRTIRPLITNEADEIIKLLHRENADNPTRLNISPAKFNNYQSINLILNPSIIENEKIIEGWILDNIGKNQTLDSAFGPFSEFGNNVPAGYLKFMDIFGIQKLYNNSLKYKIIEVKINNCSFPQDINQLIGYMDWVTENIASGDYKSVEGILFTKGFNQNTIDFINN